MGTCQPWATFADLCHPCNAYELDPALVEQKLQIASDVLYELTGRRWPGVCTDVVRPCSQAAFVSAWTSSIVRGRPVSWGMCGCGRGRQCGCSRLSEVWLPGYPVQSISEVWLDGALLDASHYRVDDSRYLVWLPQEGDDRSGWPCCQRLDLTAGEPDTFEVTYQHGGLPDVGGIASAATLACEMVLAVQPDLGDCRLTGVTQVNRQGVSITVVDPAAMVTMGITGLPEVDLWVASTRLGAQRRRATAKRLGRPRAVRRTGQ